MIQCMTFDSSHHNVFNIKWDLANFEFNNVHIYVKIHIDIININNDLLIIFYQKSAIIN